jgi:hypothetical protein
MERIDYIEWRVPPKHELLFAGSAREKVGRLETKQGRRTMIVLQKSF